ncbi:S66 family peptidase [Arthrobacter sp. SAFR-014]|uniref:S66 family peptidase n=1 Tax=unclassified Arthrobacter TaxID=235627 RepID=UPI003F7BEF68
MPQSAAFVPLPKLAPGDRVAVLSPSFAAPGFAPAIHERAMQRLFSVTGLVPVEYATTRTLGASAQERAADVNAAFADPSIRAIFTTVGGDDQITVVAHLNAELALSDPKPFFGYSDNTNILNWLWSLGIPGYYGGSTQVHIGPGPHIDEVHLTSLRAALFEDAHVNIFDPGASEDFGPDWRSLSALTDFGSRERTEPWLWAGPRRIAEGGTWGGCFEVIDQLALANRLPPLECLQGKILLLEASEEIPPAVQIRRWVRALGERGVLAAVDGILVARPPASNYGVVPPPHDRAQLRTSHYEAVISEVARYNDDAVVCLGVPFGHTRPQWILPYGGNIRLDGFTQVVTADYTRGAPSS